VLLLAGSYLQWLEAAEKLISSLSDSEHASIFGGTAALFYGIQA
jgi:predicted TIM-barrel fold metal-dependent hydrolase